MIQQYYNFFKLFLFYRYKGFVVFTFLLTFLSSFFSSIGMGLYIPVIGSFIKDKGSENIFINMSNYLLKLVDIQPNILSLIILATATIILGAATTYITMLCSGYLYLFTYRSIKEKIITDILNRPYTYFHKEKVGNIVAVITEQATLAAGTVHYIFLLFTKLLLTTGFFITLCFISLKLTFILFFLGLTIALSQLWLFNLVQKYYDRWNVLKLKIASFFTESITGIKTIKLMGLEKYRQQQAESLISYESSIIFRTHALHHFSPFYNMVFSIILASVGIYVGLKYLLLPASTIMVFFIIITRIFNSLQGLNQAWLEMIKSLPNISLVMDYLDHSTTIKSGTNNLEFNNLISINNLSFAFGTKDILTGINLEIQKNHFIALVGPSGGGKTTLTDLILGIYQPLHGTILYDDQPITYYQHDNWCKCMGVVSQDIFLFNDTITNNIAFGDETADMDRVKLAAETAHADVFIRESEQGYNTILGDRGVKLSGGQRQRIALARALYHNPAILILDEATSALDSESERYIQEALDKIRGGITIIAVAHRLSTIRKADLIVYIDEGEIKEQGTHEQLMEKDSNYKKLIMQQTK